MRVTGKCQCELTPPKPKPAHNVNQRIEEEEEVPAISLTNFSRLSSSALAMMIIKTTTSTTDLLFLLVK